MNNIRSQTKTNRRKGARVQAWRQEIVVVGAFH